MPRATTDAAKALLAARNEIAKENMTHQIAKFKVLLRDLAKAETIVANLKREIADLEEAIEQGNA